MHASGLRRAEWRAFTPPRDFECSAGGMGSPIRVAISVVVVHRATQPAPYSALIYRQLTAESVARCTMRLRLNVPLLSRRVHRG